MTPRTSVTLFELQHQIRQHLADGLNHPVWVVAEISDITVNRSGHCYLEWIEKDGESDQIVAKARATIWANQFRMLKPYFETVAGKQLGKGLKILWRGKVEYHEVYGLSIQVLDLDPAYTLGDMERRRREILLRLSQEGVAYLNKELELPLVPQRIAVISSATAAGYEDFVKQLTQGTPRYAIYPVLFPAVMQGNGAEASMVAALEQIYAHEELFDVVVIVRGGGSSTDLWCFDNYELAVHVAQFPLPVLTGIGHERDESVVDQVAHTRLKTPTAVAAFILQRFALVSEIISSFEARFALSTQSYVSGKWQQVDSLSNRTKPLIQQRMHVEERRLAQAWHRLELGTSRMVQKHSRRVEWMQQRVFHASVSGIHAEITRIDTMVSKLPVALYHYWQRKEDQLRWMEKTAFLVDPLRLLQRGYSLSYVDGKLVRNPSQVNPGDVLITRMAEGEMRSIVANQTPETLSGKV